MPGLGPDDNLDVYVRSCLASLALARFPSTTWELRVISALDLISSAGSPNYPGSLRVLDSGVDPGPVLRL